MTRISMQEVYSLHIYISCLYMTYDIKIYINFIFQVDKSRSLSSSTTHLIAIEQILDSPVNIQLPLDLRHRVLSGFLVSYNQKLFSEVAKS